MEKILIRPVSKDIVLRGNAKDGSFDLFSYDYGSDPNRRGLGNLYVVGNVLQSETSDTGADDVDIGYVINLVASLAKREYYSKPDLSPKEAFGSALKKINGVVEEFFKRKDTKINIGIFAIAGEEIHISKLGKFKIILGRDDKTIDILNNVNLFNKESTREKEFSNIISGKVHSGDRVLAFYPSRAITAREKSIKDNFLKTEQTDFAAKLTSIKSDKPDFGCAVLHIEMQRTSEEALAPKIQPKELREEVEEETPMPEVQADLAKAEDLGQDEAEVDPKIIPSEFSLGRKEIPLAKHLRRIKHMNINSHNRRYVMGGAVTLIVLAVVILKMFVFVSSSTRVLNAAISQAESNLKLAEAKISQNDLVGARSLLVSALSSLSSLEDSSKAEDAQKEISKTLDNLEQATDALVSLADDKDFSKMQNVPASLSELAQQFKSSYLYQDNLYGLTDSGVTKITDATKGKTGASSWLQNGAVVASNPVLITVDGNVYILSENGTLTTYYKGQKKTEANTPISVDSSSVLLTNDESPNLYVINKTMGRIYVLKKDSGSLVKTLKINAEAPITSAALDENDVVYVLSDNKTWKVQ